MFGFSFGELLIVAIIAVLFLGPDKLPKAFIDMAKFFKAVKKTINDAKDVIDREVNISEIKKEALEYKKKFEENTQTIKNDLTKNSNLDELANILNEPLEEDSKSSKKTQKMTMEEVENESKKMLSKINLKPKTDKNKIKSKETKKSDSKDLKKSTKTIKKPLKESKNTKTNNKKTTTE